MLEPEFILNFDIDSLAAGFGLPVGETIRLVSDGRVLSKIIEHRIADETGWVLRARDKKGYDLADRTGRLWEARVVSARGVRFSPSSMNGKGRVIVVPEMLAIWERLRGFALADITQFPFVPVTLLWAPIVTRWWHRGRLGSHAEISYARLRAALREVDGRGTL